MNINQQLENESRVSHACDEQKRQIVLRCSGPDGVTIKGKNVPAYFIDKQGGVTQFYDDARAANGKMFPKCAIQVMLGTAGPLLPAAGEWYPVRLVGDLAAPNLEQEPRIPYEYCSCNKFRGFQWHEYYTNAQMKALEELLALLVEKHGIAFLFDNQLGNVCPRAIAGEPGIFLDGSYSDRIVGAHPQHELVQIIKRFAS